MPFPNEHAARLQDPKKFDKFRRVAGGKIFGGRLEVPKTIGVIWGHLKDAPPKAWAVQTLRFPTKDWSVKDAEKWLKDNKIKPKLFEPAEKKSVKKVLELHKSIHSLWDKPDDDLEFIGIVRQEIHSAHDAIVNDMQDAGLEHGSILVGKIGKAEDGLEDIDEHIFNESIGEFQPIAYQDEGPELDARILKADDEECIVYGIVLEPNIADAQGDIVTEEEVRKACHYYMEKSQKIGYQHSNFKKKFKLLESYIVPSELTINRQVVKKGSWVLAVKVIDDKTWKEVKSGEITGFSIAGTGTRIKTKAA